MEVINVWLDNVSSSWRGCAPPVVTESSEWKKKKGLSSNPVVTGGTVKTGVNNLTPQNNTGALVVTAEIMPKCPPRHPGGDKKNGLI